MAALVVVFHHLVLTFVPALKSSFGEIQAHHFLFRLFGNSPCSVILSGSYAVRLFFLLSGFVLSISYFKSRQSSLVSSLALRRYPRLMLPVLASVLFAWIIQEFHGYRNRMAASWMNQGSDSWLSYWYQHHISLIQALNQGLFGTFFNFNEATSLNAPLWTMPIELAGSFCVFSFLALVGNLPRRFLIYLILAWVFERTNIYLLDFLAGIALCDVHVALENSGNKWKLTPVRAWIMLLIGLALGGLSSDWLTCYTHLGAYGEAVWPTVASLLIVGSAVFCREVQNVLQHSALSFLGKISFQLYLFHHIIICSLGCGLYIFLRAELFSHLTSAVVASLLSIAASVLVAWVAYYAVDLPSINLGHKLIRPFHLSGSKSPPLASHGKAGA